LHGGRFAIRNIPQEDPYEADSDTYTVGLHAAARGRRSDRLRAQPGDGTAAAGADPGVAGDPDGPAGRGPGGTHDRAGARHRASELRPAPRPADRPDLRAAQPAVALRRGGRPDAQRVRAAGRADLLHARHAGPDELRGRTGGGAGARDRAHHGAAPGGDDHPCAGGADRAGARRRALPAAGAAGRHRGPGHGPAVSALRPRRGAAGRRPGLPLHARAGLRRAGDGCRLPVAGGPGRGAAQRGAGLAADAPAARRTNRGGAAARRRGRAAARRPARGPRHLSDAHRRHGLRRQPAQRVFPRKPVSAPGPALSARVSRGLAASEPGPGR